MSKIISLLLIIAAIVVLVIVGPLATIWALNTLFPGLAIPYTIYTWLAVIVLGAAIRANVSIKKD